MNNQVISEVAVHKHLGLTFTNDCTWLEHLAQIKTKAWQRINIMRKLKFLLDRKSLQTIYFFFIRPLLEYADVVWDNCTQYEVDELEKIQNEAARIVTGATRLVSINLLHCETGWDSLASRRNKHKIIMFHKMYTGLSPAYLSALYQLLLALMPPTIYETQTIFKRYNVDLSCITSHFYLVLYEHGTASPRTPKRQYYCITEI